MELCDKALGTSIYEDLPATAQIKLTDFLRVRNTHQPKETNADICFIHAINNAVGVPFIARIRDLVWLQTHHAGQRKTQIVKHLIEFLDRRGFYNLEKGWVPYQYADGTKTLLKLRPGYEFTVEQRAVSGWSLPAFNYYLAKASQATTILIRLDRSPVGFERELCSHVVSADWDPLKHCYCLQDTDGPRLPLLQDVADLKNQWLQMQTELALLLSDCHRITVYEFVNDTEQRQPCPNEQGLLKVYDQLKKNPKGLSIATLHGKDAPI